MGAVQLALSREVSALEARGRAGAGAGGQPPLVVLALLDDGWRSSRPSSPRRCRSRGCCRSTPSGAVAMVALLVAPAALYVVFLGELQGRQQFPRLAAALALPVRRPPRALGPSRWWAGGSTARWSPRLSRERPPSARRRGLVPRRAAPRVAPAPTAAVTPFVRALLPIVVALASVTALTNVNLLIVKGTRLSDHDAGFYAAASTLAKLAFFLPIAIVSILFPRVAARRARGEPTDDILGRALIVTVAFCVALFGFYAVASGPIVHLTFGSEFDDAAPLLGLFGLGMTAFSMRTCSSATTSPSAARASRGSSPERRSSRRSRWPASTARSSRSCGSTRPSGGRCSSSTRRPAAAASPRCARASRTSATRWRWRPGARAPRPRPRRARRAIARTSSRRPWCSPAAAAFAVFLTWPLVLHLGDRFLGRPGDSTGTIWTLWQLAEHHGYHFLGTTPQDLTGAPFGWEVGNWLYLQVAWSFYPAYLVAEIAGEVVAYNLLVLSGFVLSGAAMYLLVRRIGAGRLAASWAALVFMTFPWMMEKAQGHVGFVHLEGFPLLLLALLGWRRRPTFPRALLVAGALLLLWLTSAYFGVIATIATRRRPRPRRAVAAPRPRDAPRARAWAWPARRRSGPSWSWAALVTLGTSSTGLDLGRIAGELIPYGARWWEFLLPHPRNPFFGDEVSPFLLSHLHGSNLSETLALRGLADHPPRGRLAGVGGRPPPQPLGAEQRFLAVTLPVLVVVAVAFSLPSPLMVFGTELQMPSRLLFEATGSFRVPTRFIALVMVALVPLAALGPRSPSSVASPARSPAGGRERGGRRGVRWRRARSASSSSRLCRPHSSRPSSRCRPSTGPSTGCRPGRSPSTRSRRREAV